MNGNNTSIIITILARRDFIPKVHGYIISPPITLFINESYIMTTSFDYIKNSRLTSIEELVQAVITLTILIPLVIFIMTRRKLRIKKSHQFFVNLLLMHAMFNVAVIISNLVDYSPAQLIFNCGFIIGMFIGLMVITVDRAVAIKYPFVHADIETKYIVITLLFSWLPTFMFLCLSFLFGVTQYMLTMVSTVLIIISTIVLILCNGFIYSVAKKHDQFLKDNTAQQALANKSRKMLKASYVCFAVVISFVILWFPYLVHNLLVITGLYYQSAEKLFTKVVGHVVLLNSIGDAILFVWLSRDTKKELISLYRKIFNSNKKDHVRESLVNVSLANSGQSYITTSL